MFNAPSIAANSSKSERNAKHTPFKWKPLAITFIFFCLVLLSFLPHYAPFSPRPRSFIVNLIAVQVNKNHGKINSTSNDHLRIWAKWQRDQQTFVEKKIPAKWSIKVIPSNHAIPLLFEKFFFALVELWYKAI